MTLKYIKIKKKGESITRHLDYTSAALARGGQGAAHSTDRENAANRQEPPRKQRSIRSRITFGGSNPNLCGVFRRFFNAEKALRLQGKNNYFR